MTLNLTEETVPEGYERLVFAEDTESGLQAFICVHSTTLGPAAGGCRMWDYATLDEARRDVLRLAQGMTCKNAMADLALGGGAILPDRPTPDRGWPLGDRRQCPHR